MRQCMAVQGGMLEKGGWRKRLHGIGFGEGRALEKVEGRAKVEGKAGAGRWMGRGGWVQKSHGC